MRMKKLKRREKSLQGRAMCLRFNDAECVVIAPSIAVLLDICCKLAPGMVFNRALCKTAEVKEAL